MNPRRLGLHSMSVGRLLGLRNGLLIFAYCSHVYRLLSTYFRVLTDRSRVGPISTQQSRFLLSADHPPSAQSHRSLSTAALSISLATTPLHQIACAKPGFRAIALQIRPRFIVALNPWPYERHLGCVILDRGELLF